MLRLLLVQEDALMRAVVEGERCHKWDFSQGPCHIRLLLRVCNRRDVAASLCCETGTTLDLTISDADRASPPPPFPPLVS